MGTLTVRNIPDDAMARLGDLASAEHTSMEALVREQIIGLSKSIVQKDAYTIHFLRTEEVADSRKVALASGMIIRRRSGSIRGSYLISPENEFDYEAYQKAAQLAERNYAGDRERIIVLLGKQYDHVIEAPAED